MSGTFRRAWNVYKEEGLIGLTQALVWRLRSRYYQLKGTRTLSIGHTRITMPIIGYRASWDIDFVQTTEHGVIEELLRELEPNDVFWDIGANLGYYSCLVAAFNKSVYVVAFEPNPITVDRLKGNIELNKLPNVKVVDIALSNSDGRAAFDLVNAQSSHGLAHLSNTKANETIEVKTATGDKLVEDGIALRPTIVKIDVEGAEHLVIEGMKNILADCRVVFCEVHPNEIGKYGSSPEELEKTLNDLGFRLKRIQQRTNTHLKAYREE